MRGEHLERLDPEFETVGSPPHARGAPIRALLEIGKSRITPACAGSTWPKPGGSGPKWDHPRMRGEHEHVKFVEDQMAGSPPHARGARRLTAHLPALLWDHPRMRGEHFYDSHNRDREMGSPPHARGALIKNNHPNTKPGITPACAGSTSTPRRRSSSIRDHPRMRGEHPSLQLGHTESMGSPPHARGAPPWTVSLKGQGRITPACAGSTALQHCNVFFARDHPRMRGEHKAISFFGCPLPGSPPHARGALMWRCAKKRWCGITPACAGSTQAGSGHQSGLQDHPRMRGEHHIFWPSVRVLPGSPPHARGALSARYDRIRGPGITPACAGSTIKTHTSRPDNRDHPRMRGEHRSPDGSLREYQGSPPHARGALL